MGYKSKNHNSFMQIIPGLKQFRPFFLLILFAFAARTGAQTNPPNEWIDPDTGHRVVQLSTEPGSESLYFNLNPFTPDGQKMVITTPGGISTINLQTRAVEKIVDGRVNVIMVGHKTGQIYYIKNEIANGVTNHVVCATDPADEGHPRNPHARARRIRLDGQCRRNIARRHHHRELRDEPRIFWRRRPEPFDRHPDRRPAAHQ